MMYIKGEFRDVIKRNDEIIEDRGWKSNKIEKDFGKFLAAVMKKDFQCSETSPICIGIEYIAVGGGLGDFKKMVGEFLNKITTEDNFDPNKPYKSDEYSNWVWAKKINAEEISYDNSENEVTDSLRIEVKFDNKHPENADPLKFAEFSLLGYNKKGTNTDSNAKLFFINYATHGIITKANDMSITRTIKLTFPIDEF